MIKVLVVEDDIVARKLYEDFLRESLCPPYAQSDMKSVATGEEAIGTLEAMLSKGEKPDLVITGNQLPPGKISGMSVLYYVKAKVRGTKVIMIASEDYGSTVKRKAMQRGASAFLERPFSLQTFRETVRKYAAKR